MKKKKHNTDPVSDLEYDLKSIIHQHSLFFDKLIELIPARFYLPVADKEKPWFQGLSKVAKASAKKESRENIKKARRARLDPEKASTTLDLLKENLDKEKSDEKPKEEEKEAEAKTISLSNGEDRSVTYEELRQRLHRRIEELRSNRNAEASDKVKSEKRREMQLGKRKRSAESGEHNKPKPSVLSAEKNENDVAEASKKLAFGNVKIGNEDEHGRKKKKKLSKSQTLEKAKKLEEEKKDPEKGDIISKKHSLKAAMSRAAGIKVHDDPKLLKESIKKEKKRHEKNVDKWKGRIENREKIKAEKQQKRSKNISEKIHQKKLRKIAKREKKLMRPGFEGRKEGFINKS